MLKRLKINTHLNPCLRHLLLALDRGKTAKSLNLDVKYLHMIGFLLKKIISRQKELILQEATRIQDFMRLLMKLRNTGKKWTREEKKQLKLHIIHLSAYVPILIIFLLPGGSLLVPILADILERRKKKERVIQQDADLV